MNVLRMKILRTHYIFSQIEWVLSQKSSMCLLGKQIISELNHLFFFHYQAVVLVLSHFSRFWLFAILWTIAHQALLSRDSCRWHESWNGFSPPGDLPDPGIEPTSLMSLALAGGFFTSSATSDSSKLETNKQKINEIYFHLRYGCHSSSPVSQKEWPIFIVSLFVTFHSFLSY